MSLDAIVVGAGPAGSATAWHLAQAGARTLLLDKSDFPRDKVCGDCLSPRAQHYLARLGLAEAVAVEAHAATRIRFRAPGGAEASTAITGNGALPDRTLVLPRLRFDALLWRHALAAGAEFRIAHVRELLPTGGVVLDGQALPARIVIIATGAALSLIRHTPLAPPGPVHSVAARCYLDGLPQAQSDLCFFFDRLPLPGYAWRFPTGAHSANLGYWYNGRAGVSATAELQRLLSQHPALAELTAGARGTGRVAGYPIRTDFLTARKHADGVLAVGEAAGLVNPFTGEGIDYALESAELAAAVIARALRSEPAGKALSAGSLAAYPRALDRHFRALFLLMAVAQRSALNPFMLDRLFGRGAAGQGLVERLIAVCFGAAPPRQMLAPMGLVRLLLARPARPAGRDERQGLM